MITAFQLETTVLFVCFQRSACSTSSSCSTAVNLVAAVASCGTDNSGSLFRKVPLHTKSYLTGRQAQGSADLTHSTAQHMPVGCFTYDCVTVNYLATAADILFLRGR